MVIIADLLIMVGLPVALFVIHRLCPESVGRNKNLFFGILTGWFLYTFFGSRLVRGESMLMVGYSVLIVAVLAATMVVILKNFPDQARRYNQQIRFGFMAAAVAAMVAGWTVGGF